MQRMSTNPILVSLPVLLLPEEIQNLCKNSSIINDSNIPLNVPLPLPPPPDEAVPEIPLSTQFMDSLTKRTTTLEGEVQACTQNVSQCCSHSELMDQCRLIEEKLYYKIERECERVKNVIELSISDLGKSMVGCLKRRNAQINSKLKPYAHVMSVPVSFPLITPALPNKHQ